MNICNSVLMHVYMLMASGADKGLKKVKDIKQTLVNGRMTYSK